MSSRDCIKVEEYKRFATLVATSHGSPLTWESGWACLPCLTAGKPVGKSEVR